MSIFRKVSFLLLPTIAISKNFNYKITKEPNPKQIFSYDGEKVTINFDNLKAVKVYYLDSEDQYLIDDYNLLNKTLNEEQIYECEHCHLLDLESSLKKNILHNRANCYYNKMDEHINKESFYPRIMFKMLPTSMQEYEKKRLRKTLDDKISYGTTPLNIRFLLDRYEFNLKRDLDIKKYSPETRHG